MNQKMKRIAYLSLLAAGAAIQAAAHGQSVTVYGIVDTGVEVLNHVNAASNTLVRMPNITASVPSRFGFRGSEDLGGGTKAVFVLESGFGPDTGALNYGGRLFGRQAYVGINGNYGAVSLGRQYTMTFYALLDADILGPNIYSMANLDNYLPNARSDNTVGYLGKSGTFSYGATYSLGRDSGTTGGPQATNCPGEIASDLRACRQWSAMLKYDAGQYGLSASYDELHGGPNAAFGLTSSDFRDVRSTVSGYFKFGSVKMGAGWLGRHNTSASSFKSDLIHVGITYAVSPVVVLDGQIGHLNVKDSANDSTILALRATYSFSPRTSVYATTGYIRNRGTAALSVSSGGTVPPGQNQAGVMLGVRHAF